MKCPLSSFPEWPKQTARTKAALPELTFSVRIYIFLSTLFELLGIQAVTTHGASIALPAPIADINAAIAMGVLSYIVILGAGIICGGAKVLSMF